ncbi:MAG: hypothetical protein M0P69_20920 [Bacteroidales bacterium]|nr:hypothetical protein [Bacteroidales bacterium]
MQKDYMVTLNGMRDLLMHKDNIQHGERVKKWSKDPANKDVSVAGDDRSPAWTWIGYLYAEYGKVVIDSDNLMTMLREGGAQVSTGKGKKTFKAQTQSGIIVNEIGWPLIVDWREIDYEPIKALLNENDFEKHLELAEELGFTLFVKRAKIGMSKHIRVRPRFSNWQASGTITVTDPMLTKDVLQDILTFAGARCGLCDWRPSSKSPGQFGTFMATLEEI